MKSKINCSVEILTRNSEKTLARCLESVKDFAEIIILDGNSSDRTLDIAKQYGCVVYKQIETEEPNVRITDFSEVRNKGLGLASRDWFMYIDSDEYLSPEAVGEIRSIIESRNPEVGVWWQPRKYVIGGKIIERASTYPNRQIRFFLRSAVKEFVKPIHEKIEVREGEKIGVLKNFEYVPLGDIGSLRSRWDGYLELEKNMLGELTAGRFFKLVFMQKKILTLYTARYVRNLFFGAGMRAPLSYELARQEYHIKMMLMLTKKFLKRN